jgi:hypothetical protein
VQLARAEILARQDTFYGRINGTVLQGSNDNTTWETISSPATGTLEWQTLSITNNTPYRYIRAYNGGNWYGNMNELKLYGVVASTNKIATASISSPQALRTRIVPGSTVKLNFTAKEAVNNVTATIQGVPATVTTTDNINFVATATLPQGTAPGQVKFEADYTTAAGKAGYPLTAASDGTVLYLVDEADVLRNLTTSTTLIDTTSNRSAASTATITGYLFDANADSGTDYRLGTGGAGGSITFDFNAGNQATLTGVELLARQDKYYTRAKYTVVQGSNDNANWTTLTTGAAATPEWQTFPVTGGVPYRYIRIWNATTWYGNLNEVRFHGTVHGVDTTAPVTTVTANPAAPQNGWYASDVTLAFSAADASPGSTTYYSVDGGAQQSGTSLVLSAKGMHNIAYWSVDQAGNAEAAHTLGVNIGPIDLGASVKMTQQGATLNRATGKYVGGVTVTNVGAATLSGPLQLELSGLTSGVTLDNASGSSGGYPYVTLTGGLAPGASVTVPLTFSNPARSVIGYTPLFFEGSL